MNKKRREDVWIAIHIMERALGILNSVYDKENNSLNNIPENLQSSGLYNEIEDSCDALENAIEYIENSISCLERV